ncbi:MAG: hypothetical protein PHI50_03575 [Alphaproteobacteria bacterium]|nr:hypothetical protein [Alphaproteobacteria bacterium]
MSSPLESPEYLEALKIIEDLSQDYEKNALSEVQEMEDIFSQAQRDKDITLLTKDLFRKAHDMKGQGITFGYPLITFVGNHLCRYLENKTVLSESLLKGVRFHLDIISKIFEDKIKSEETLGANEIKDQVKKFDIDLQR